MFWWHSRDKQWKQTVSDPFCERFERKVYCGFQVHRPKQKILVLPLGVPRNPSSCASWYTITIFWLMETPKKCHKLTLPPTHILSTRYLLNVGGTLLIKAGDIIVKVWVIGKGRMLLLRGRWEWKTWIYSWMHCRVIFQEEYEMWVQHVHFEDLCDTLFLMKLRTSKKLLPFIYYVVEIWHYKGNIRRGWWRKDIAHYLQSPNSTGAELLFLLEEGGETLWDDHKLRPWRYYR